MKNIGREYFSNIHFYLKVIFRRTEILLNLALNTNQSINQSYLEGLGLKFLWRYKCIMIDYIISMFFAATFKITSIFDILVISNLLIPFSNIVLFWYFRMGCIINWRKTRIESNANYHRINLPNHLASLPVPVVFLLIYGVES